MPFGGLQALGPLSTVAEMMYDADVFLVDVFYEGIFPEAGKRGVEFPLILAPSLTAD